jgi:hypothetical protein
MVTIEIMPAPRLMRVFAFKRFCGLGPARGPRPHGHPAAHAEGRPSRRAARDLREVSARREAPRVGTAVTPAPWAPISARSASGALYRRKQDQNWTGTRALFFQRHRNLRVATVNSCRSYFALTLFKIRPCPGPLCLSDDIDAGQSHCEMDTIMESRRSIQLLRDPLTCM